MAPERRQFARALRQQMTRAEDILSRSLRRSRFEGAKFRRQVPFDRYVVDFYCHAAKLVVELDGKQHEWFADYDAGRTEILRAARHSGHSLYERRGLRRPRCRSRSNSRRIALAVRLNGRALSLRACPLPLGEGRVRATGRANSASARAKGDLSRAGRPRKKPLTPAPLPRGEGSRSLTGCEAGHSNANPNTVHTSLRRLVPRVSPCYDGSTAIIKEAWHGS